MLKCCSQCRAHFKRVKVFFSVIESQTYSYYIGLLKSSKTFLIKKRLSFLLEDSNKLETMQCRNLFVLIVIRGTLCIKPANRLKFDTY